MALSAQERLLRAREALRAAELGSGLVHGATEGIESREGASGVLHVDGGRAELVAALRSLLPEGGWAGVVGVPDLGWEAVARAGVDLSRVLAVPDPGADPARVCGLLLEAVDVVCVGGGLVPARSWRRLAALARTHRRVLVATEPWPGVSRPWRALRLAEAAS